MDCENPQVGSVNLFPATMACGKNPRVRSVNLGGWLVVEGWMKPTLFDDIHNKDFLDGTQLQISSVRTGMYLSAKNGGGGNIVADKDVASKEETFRLWRIDEKTFNFRVANRQFVGLSKAGDDRIVAVENEPQDTEIFVIHRNPNSNDKNRVKIKASNGFFLQVNPDNSVTADYPTRRNHYKNECGDDNYVDKMGCYHDEWDYNNPSVFVLNVNTILRGEYQITNGYGPNYAPQVMMRHWKTYIVEEDFQFIKESGLNTVRIPVGWWTAYDAFTPKHHISGFLQQLVGKAVERYGPELPPKPYVAGSLQFLDKAFDWAEKYGIKIIIDFHAAPGSQSGWEPSSSRDGEQEWGSPAQRIVTQEFGGTGQRVVNWGGTGWIYKKLSKPTLCRDGFHEWTYDNDHIQESVDIIEFFAHRYAKRRSLFGVELLNEPRKPHVDLDVLKDYYKLAYKAVRRHSEDAYVVMCDRLGLYGVQDPSELLDLAKSLLRSVIDVHYYNLFEPKFFNFTVQDNIDYTERDREREIKKIRDGGALLFIGEWAAGMQVKDATEEDYKKFAETKMKVYGHATFGWGYWSLKNVYNMWSLEWMIRNGYIQIPQPN